MNYYKKIIILFAIVSASINVANAVDGTTREDFDNSGAIVRAQNTAQIYFDSFSDEVQVMVLSNISGLTDIQSCMSVSYTFHEELKRIVINRMDIHNVCYQSLPPFYIASVLQLPILITVIKERMPGGSVMEFYNKKIIYTDKFNRTFEVTGGKCIINQVYGYGEMGNFDSLLNDLKGTDLHALVSYHKRDEAGCSLRYQDIDSGLVRQGWTLTLAGKEYNLYFNEFTTGL